MRSLVTGTVAAVLEAWTHVRIGRLRILLSLVGVSVAVAAMTFVIAFGQVASEATQHLMEQYGGRPGSVQIAITPKSTTGSDEAGALSGDASAPGGTAAVAAPSAAPAEGSDSQGDPSAANTVAGRVAAAEADFVKRYAITQWATSYPAPLRLSLSDGPTTVSGTVVSGRYGLLHHVPVVQGRWFTTQDEDDLSPSVVVSQSVLDQMGVTSLSGPLKVRSLAPYPSTYTIVGVLEPEDLTGCTAPDAEGNMSPCLPQLTAYVLQKPFETMMPASATRTPPALEVWAGDGREKEMEQLAETYFNGVFGRGSTSASSMDGMSTGSFDRVFTLVVSGGGFFVMLLGALGLINISLVTVRQRIHEIGLRRAFGATSRRIFFSIMLESVVATVVAGVVGIGIAIVAMRFVPMHNLLGFEPTVRPPFPMSAALIGLAAATLVGALAGIIPAVVAVRIRPIDAIRY